MLALSLLLILLGIVLLHSAISGKSIATLVKGVSNIDTKAEPSLNTEPEAEKTG